MSFDITILKRQVNNIRSAMENGKFGDALISAMNSGSGLMQERIFSGNKDIEGNSFGQYVGAPVKQRSATTNRLLSITTSRTDIKRIKAASGLSLTPYQRKRANAGRQILHKDLEFTGGLRRSIETQLENDRTIVLQFNNDEAALIAHGQEHQITNIRLGGKGTTSGTGAVKIFTFNADEREQVGEQGRELINQIINDGINNPANTR